MAEQDSRWKAVGSPNRRFSSPESPASLGLRMPLNTEQNDIFAFPSTNNSVFQNPPQNKSPMMMTSQLSNGGNSTAWDKWNGNWSVSPAPSPLIGGNNNSLMNNAGDSGPFDQSFAPQMSSFNNNGRKSPVPLNSTLQPPLQKYSGQPQSQFTHRPPQNFLSPEEYSVMPKNRSRSKSSSAAVYMLPQGEQSRGLDWVPEIASIWGEPSVGTSSRNAMTNNSGFNPQNNNTPELSVSIGRDSTQGPPFHRRASTQPSNDTVMWEALVSAQLATPSDPNGEFAESIMNQFKMEATDPGRRFSVAPSVVNRYMQKKVEFEEQQQNETTNNSSLLSPNYLVQSSRRHSVANPQHAHQSAAFLTPSFLTDGFESLGLYDSSNNNNNKNNISPISNNNNNTLTSSEDQTIDDYFENTSNRQKSALKAGINLHAAAANNSNSASTGSQDTPNFESSSKWPLCVVEFKAGRTDYFFKNEENMQFNVGDLVIVEADRGKDLGKVIYTGISSDAELEQYRATHTDPLVDSHNALGKDIKPKRLYRLAQRNEIAMLLPKSQDEQQASDWCQSKIRQKKLPMEIVDAEYQWDRRKLTFYFVADHRIDFRELVRELFKIYKTRIWMYFKVLVYS